MTRRARQRTKLLGFVATVVLSSVSMLWLFWRHPVTTGIVTLAVLAAFGISARLARLIDTDSQHA